MKPSIRLFAYASALILLASFSAFDAESEQLTMAMYDEKIGSKEFAFINFYADWCRFSQMLKPMWDEMAKQVEELQSEGALIGKVDCDAENGLAQKFNVNKYPTMKMVRNGRIVRKEYRGQRSVEALVMFVKNQLKDPLQEVTSLQDIREKAKKRSIVGYYETASGENFQKFKQIASELRDHCGFYIATGEEFQNERLGGQDTVVFKDQAADDVLYTGQMDDAERLRQWALSNCIPLVREITFENGEELTEEGLPFLILFHDPSDLSSLKLFKEKVAQDLLHEKSTVNFITADGLKFSHPLSHLGKSTKDLPILAIDSFRHMYVFPNFEDIKIQGRLAQFIDDLKSGKLHREFHHGPDAVKEVEKPKVDAEQPPASEDSPSDAPADAQAASDQRKPQPIQRESGSGGGAARSKRSDGLPPESTFKKILPSSNRYTLLRGGHDEL